MEISSMRSGPVRGSSQKHQTPRLANALTGLTLPNRYGPFAFLLVAGIAILFVYFEATRLKNTNRQQNHAATLSEEDSSNEALKAILQSNLASAAENEETQHVASSGRVPDILMKEDWKNTTKIRQISLIGERNSGTTWITRHLRECFNHSIPIISDLSRHKHWFQEDVIEEMRVHDTLVVAQFRNPCLWVEAMRFKSYRSPMHYKIDDWEKFVKTPWTMPHRLPYDTDLANKFKATHRGAFDASRIPCQENFTYNQVNSCLKRPYLEGERIKERAKRRAKRREGWGYEMDGLSGQEPLYELNNDGSGRPYSTILELRSDKIRNFLGVYSWDWVAAVLPIQYDEMVRDGTSSLISNIERLTGVKANCTPSPPQHREPRKLRQDFVDWMTKYVDWETEALIGYEKC